MDPKGTEKFDNFDKIIDRHNRGNPASTKKNKVFRQHLGLAPDNPFLAIATIYYHLDEIVKKNPSKKWITNLIPHKNHLYVDDFLVRVDTVEEAIALRKEVTEIFGEMKMKIRKWASNCEEVLKTIPEEYRFSIETYPDK